MKIFVSHPSGNNFSRAVLRRFDKEGLLAGFHTSIVANPSAPWLKLLPSKIRGEWLRRTYPIESSRIITRPLLEFLRLTLPKIGLVKYTRGENRFASLDAVYIDSDKNLARKLPDLLNKNSFEGVYVYEDAAIETFKVAKQLGLTCIYDLPIAYWETGRRLMMEEAQRMPSWAVTLGGGIKDSEEKLRRKTEELRLADVVVVPGSFVKDSLPAWAGNKKIIVAPFGSPDTPPGQEPVKKSMTNRPLRVLFAGGMGQRKGLGDLFNAVKILNTKNIELVVLGSPLAPLDFYKNEFQDFRYESTRPNAKVLELMQSCDVFCLPSIVEGRALVMQEAMSQGLPLIITENSGGSDLIMEGKTGFLVPIRSPQAIAEKISWFLDNRSMIPEMSNAARQHAAKYTWENYGSIILNNLKSF